MNQNSVKYFKIESSAPLVLNSIRERLFNILEVRFPEFTVSFNNFSIGKKCYERICLRDLSSFGVLIDNLSDIHEIAVSARCNLPDLLLGYALLEAVRLGCDGAKIYCDGEIVEPEMNDADSVWESDSIEFVKSLCRQAHKARSSGGKGAPDVHFIEGITRIFMYDASLFPTALDLPQQRDAFFRMFTRMQWADPDILGPFHITRRFGRGEKTFWVYDNTVDKVYIDAHRLPVGVTCDDQIKILSGPEFIRAVQWHEKSLRLDLASFIMKKMDPVEWRRFFHSIMVSAPRAYVKSFARTLLFRWDMTTDRFVTPRDWEEMIMAHAADSVEMLWPYDSAEECRAGDHVVIFGNPGRSNPGGIVAYGDVITPPFVPDEEMQQVAPRFIGFMPRFMLNPFSKGFMLPQHLLEEGFPDIDFKDCISPLIVTPKESIRFADICDTVYQRLSGFPKVMKKDETPDFAVRNSTRLHSSSPGENEVAPEEPTSDAAGDADSNL